MAELTTLKDVIKSLGGTGAVSAMFNVTPSAVSNWMAGEKFPARTFPRMSTELASRGLGADIGLWNFEKPGNKITTPAKKRKAAR